MARPRYEPTEADRNTVRSMAACGFTHEAIARCLGEEGIDPKTLRLHFRNELDTAVPKANAAVGNRLYQAAMAGEAWAVIFWLKSRAGWSERNIIEHAGAVNVNVSAKDTLRSRIVRLVERAAAGNGTSATH